MSGMAAVCPASVPTVAYPSCTVDSNWFCTAPTDRKSTRLNSSHSQISYAVFCLKKKKNMISLRTFINHSPNTWCDLGTRAKRLDLSLAGHTPIPSTPSANSSNHTIQRYSNQHH